MKTKRMVYYRTNWNEKGLWCTLGEVTCHPKVEVWFVDSKIVPFREVDKIMASLEKGTYEYAAEFIAKTLVKRYGGVIRVKVGGEDFWAEVVAKRT
jgi:hypothetical protein